MSAMVLDLSSSAEINSERLWPGLMLALLIHLLVIVAFVPSMQSAPPAAPTKIVVSVNQLQPEPEPEPDPEPMPEPEPPAPVPEVMKPKPIDNKPLLTAKNEVQKPDQILVPEQVEQVEPEGEPELVPVPEVEKPKQPEPEKKPEPKPEPRPDPKPIPKPDPKPKPEPKPAPKPEPLKEQVVPKSVEAPPATEIVEDETAPEQTVTENSAETTAEVTNPNATSASTNGKDTASSNEWNVSTGEVDRNAAWKGYGQLLYAMVSKNKEYPQLAIRRNLEGIVLVNVQFEKGELVEIKIVNPGSGHQVLDRAARKMLEKAVRAIPVRGDLVGKSFSVVVPVDFRLRG
ncbi:energy transducer TonB [uncultured Methylophaga sp.]|uniref:energy transducer TonB n=1 Tax=uncultured Methylophaga sp. TaxID=285271 RepID=UPI00261565D4|nr:energy transducer TonB [uncultured Methylophaga sp.]